MKTTVTTIFAAAMVAAVAAPAQAKSDPVELVKCEQSYGTIAVVEGATQGWSDFKLGSPRALINSLALESGCFTPHNASTGQPADYLMNVVAGDKEEVDQSIEMAKGAASEALLRTGALGSVVSKVPMGGALLGAFSAFGGKKRTVAAAIRLISPANGQTVALGSGEVRKSSLSFRSGAGGWVQGAQSVGYARSKKGKMLVEAFVTAFNDVAAQGATLQALQPAPTTAVVSAQATVAVDTKMLAGPAESAAEVRELRAGTTLTPTGKREGLFLEVEDNFGTTGWVSVEELN